MTQKHILIVEDDEAIATGLSMNLRLEGFETSIANDGERALSISQDNEPTLILLDIGLPKRDGMSVLAKLRQRGQHTPVIVLSARDDKQDKIEALRLGADDYVTKPFSVAELMARIDAVLRRWSANTSTTESFSFGEVLVDSKTRRVLRDSVDVALTHLEFELLMFFLEHPKEVLARDTILDEVWNTAGTRRTVDNFVGQLRSKLEKDPSSPKHLVTVRGSGYRFDP